MSRESLELRSTDQRFHQYDKSHVLDSTSSIFLTNFHNLCKSVRKRELVEPKAVLSTFLPLHITFFRIPVMQKVFNRLDMT